MSDFKLKNIKLKPCNAVLIAPLLAKTTIAKSQPKCCWNMDRGNQIHLLDCCHWNRNAQQYFSATLVLLRELQSHSHVYGFTSHDNFVANPNSNERSWSLLTETAGGTYWQGSLAPCVAFNGPTTADEHDQWSVVVLVACLVSSHLLSCDLWFCGCAQVLWSPK